MSKILLNLGAQIHYFEGWVNQDIVSDDPNVKAELYCDAAKLPLEDNSVDFIYAGHLVEHYYPDTLPAALAEWKRVLKPGGKLVVVTPDSGSCFEKYGRGELKIEDTYQQVYGRIYSYDRPEERHHIVFDTVNLQSFLGDEWAKREWLDFNNPPEELVPLMDKHISRSNMQLGLIVTK